MYDLVLQILDILQNLFEGYCIQFFFGRFAEPKLHRIKNVKWMTCIVWALFKMAFGNVFQDVDSITLVVKLLFVTTVLFVFCMCWYQGNMLLKLFLVTLFISLRELGYLAGYSFMYLGKRLINMLAEELSSGSTISVEDFWVAVRVLTCLSVMLMALIQYALLYGSLRKIGKSCRYREKGKMGKEVIFYLLPALAGVLVSVLLRLLMVTITDGVPAFLYDSYPILYLIVPMIALALLGAIVCSFCIYQDMAALQEEQAEKIILENQMTQMQHSMAEMEHLYDGIRAVRHDMKNQMAVLQNLIQKGNCEGDEEIRQYFADMIQSVEQLDNRVHTGNAVSDAVVGSKFRYALKQVEGIRLDADGFMLSGAIRIQAYDIGIILNNGLDNAIEACIRMRENQPDAEAYITIRSFTAKNMYFIEMENSFDGMALSRGEGGLPLSTKEDKEVHGIGLKNIRKCAVKYGGDVDCIVEGRKFILSVMIKS